MLKGKLKDGKKQTIIHGLSKEKIQCYADSDTIYQRGQDYYKNGAVTDIIQSGQEIQAKVEGSQYHPYHVVIQFDKGGIQSCDCDCPYAGNYCKHTIAVLLTCLHEADKISQNERLAEKLQRLNKPQLGELIEQLAAQDISLHRQIILLTDQRHTDKDKNITLSQPARKTAVDPKPYAQEAKHLLHSLDRMRASEAYWHVAEVVRSLGSIIDKAQAFTEKNDGNNAIVILTALTKAYVKDWTLLDGSDGDTGDFFDELDDAWCEAILSAELSLLDRKKLLQKMQDWYNEVADYGIDNGFSKAILALKQGWDYPPLVKVLNGEAVDTAEWDGEDNEVDGDACGSCYRSTLTNIRIKVLSRQQRFTECLRLAQAKQMVKEACSLMIQDNQIQAAVDYAKAHLKKSNDALLIAQILREQSVIDEAMTVATLGLQLTGSKSDLGDWLSDLAENQAKLSLALQAIIIAFKDQPSLKRYEQALRLAPKTNKHNVKENLLTALRNSKDSF